MLLLWVVVLLLEKHSLKLYLPIPRNFNGHDNWIIGLADFLQVRVIDDTILQIYRRTREQ